MSELLLGIVIGLVAAIIPGFIFLSWVLDRAYWSGIKDKFLDTPLVINRRWFRVHKQLKNKYVMQTAPIIIK